MALLRFFKWLFILHEPLTRTPRTHSTTPWNILEKKTHFRMFSLHSISFFDLYSNSTRRHRNATMQKHTHDTIYFFLIKFHGSESVHLNNFISSTHKERFEIRRPNFQNALGVFDNRPNFEVSSNPAKFFPGKIRVVLKWEVSRYTKGTFLCSLPLVYTIKVCPNASFLRVVVNTHN